MTSKTVVGRSANIGFMPVLIACERRPSMVLRVLEGGRSIVAGAAPSPSGRASTPAPQEVTQERRVAIAIGQRTASPPHGSPLPNRKKAPSRPGPCLSRRASRGRLAGRRSRADRPFDGCPRRSSPISAAPSVIVREIRLPRTLLALLIGGMLGADRRGAAGPAAQPARRYGGLRRPAGGGLRGRARALFRPRRRAVLRAAGRRDRRRARLDRARRGGRRARRPRSSSSCWPGSPSAASPAPRPRSPSACRPIPSPSPRSCSGSSARSRTARASTSSWRHPSSLVASALLLAAAPGLAGPLARRGDGLEPRRRRRPAAARHRRRGGDRDGGVASRSPARSASSGSSRPISCGRFVGYDPARTLVPAALAGAALLLAADCAVRLIPSSAEVKIGVLTALLGVPFFLWIIARRQAELAESAGMTRPSSAAGSAFRSRSAAARCCAGSTSPSSRAASPSSSARTAPARRRCCGRSPASSRRRRGAVALGGEPVAAPAPP